MSRITSIFSAAQQALARISLRTAWMILLVSALFEAVWASALGASHGFTRLAPTVVFGVALVISMIGLTIALGSIHIGTAYAVWVGIGAALTVTYAMATGVESVSAGKIVFITGIVGAVVGLRLVPEVPGSQATPPADTQPLSGE